MALEQPKYELVRRYGELEVRDYVTFWIAECSLPSVGNLNSASSYAFSRLFNYIQGRNSKTQPIQMTKPVRQEPHQGGWKISFVIPEDVRKSGIPEPSDSSISIREVTGGLYAAIVYRGSWGQSKQEAQSAKLLRLVSENKLQTKGPVISAVYNPPITPGMLRRNEVMVAIEGEK
ncbi:MAG: hypothetical protein RIS26_14 [Actinomycetota bacterium]